MAAAGGAKAGRTAPVGAGKDGAKDALTQAVLDHLLSGGDGLDQSLRSLAAAIGVSHSLLLYHFGSRGGLLSAVHEACERRERAYLGSFSDAGAGPFETMREVWVHLADPRMWPLYRVGFALRARGGPTQDGGGGADGGAGTDGGAGAGGGADDSRAPWIDALVPLVLAVGVPEERARAEALLWLATCRGLLWELVTGADPAAVEAAAETFFDHYAAAGR